MSNRQGYTRNYQTLLASLRQQGKESSRGEALCKLPDKRCGQTPRSTSAAANRQQASPGAPSVSRALPPVGVHSTAEQLLHTTTVCEWLKTVVLRTNKHKESGTLRSVIWTR